jgi:hypothetical protein
MYKIENTQELPDRNFCGGYPRNPATYVAHSDGGEYFEGFARDYDSKEAFEREAIQYFNRASGNWKAA